jgi:hypothetical protein
MPAQPWREIEITLIADHDYANAYGFQAQTVCEWVDASGAHAEAVHQAMVYKAAPMMVMFQLRTQSQAHGTADPRYNPSPRDIVSHLPSCDILAGECFTGSASRGYYSTVSTTVYTTDR